MKIAFYLTTSLEHGGGMEKYLIKIASNLAARKDCHVDLITMDGNFTDRLVGLSSWYFFKRIDKKLYHKESISSIREQLGKANYHQIKTLKDLKKKFQEYDIVCSRNEVLEAFIIKILVGYRKLPPIIFAVHTPHDYPRPKTFHDRLHNFLYNSGIYNFLVSGVCAFHVMNEESFHTLKRQFPEKKIFNLPHSFSLRELEKDIEVYKFNHEWRRAKFNIAWIGRLTWPKDVDDLVEIIRKMNQSPYKEKIVFNIFGDGEDRKKVVSVASHWDNVFYFGHVDHKYIADILSNSDLLISTSKAEVYPGNIIEAQEMGVSVVSYNIPGPRDIIVNRETGVLVESQNEFLEVVKGFVDGEYQYTKHMAEFIPQKSAREVRYCDQLIRLFEEIYQKDFRDFKTER